MTHCVYLFVNGKQICRLSNSTRVWNSRVDVGLFCFQIQNIYSIYTSILKLLIICIRIICLSLQILSEFNLNNIDANNYNSCDSQFYMACLKFCY